MKVLNKSKPLTNLIKVECFTTLSLILFAILFQTRKDVCSMKSLPNKFKSVFYGVFDFKVSLLRWLAWLIQTWVLWDDLVILILIYIYFFS